MTATRVAATCHDCHDQHPLGDRPRHAPSQTCATTECPSCGSTTYESEVIEVEGVKPDHERIADVIDVQGVGEQTRQNLLAEFTGWISFQNADLEDLKAVDGVGTANGQRIIDNRPDSDSKHDTDRDT